MRNSHRLWSTLQNVNFIFYAFYEASLETFCNHYVLRLHFHVLLADMIHEIRADISVRTSHIVAALSIRASSSAVRSHTKGFLHNVSSDVGYAPVLRAP